MDPTSPGRRLRLEQEVIGYRRRAVIAVQAAFLLGALAVLIQGLAHPLDSGTAGLLVSIGLSGTSLGLALRGGLHWAAWLSACQFLLIPSYLALTSLGTFDSAMLLFPAGLISLAILVPPQKMAVISTATVLIVVFIAIATLRGAIGNPAFQSLVNDNPIDVLVSVVVITFSGVVATYVSHIFRSMLRSLGQYQDTLESNIARQTAELAKSNVELHDAQGKLSQARVQLLRGEKLAGLETLVAGVAHELNTPISNAALTANAMQHRLAELVTMLDKGVVRKADMTRLATDLAEAADLIVRANSRARDLVASFKQVAVDQSSDRRRTFELGELVEDVLRTLRPSFGAQQIRVERELPGGLHFNGYPGPLSQVLTNLVQNALVHGFRGRTQGLIRISAKVLEASLVEIRVADDGLGMAPETLARVFEPFFTTRVNQGGSGLGMFLVQDLVTKVLGGQISVSSQVGAGTEFVLRLPVVAPEVTSPGQS